MMGMRQLQDWINIFENVWGGNAIIYLSSLCQVHAEDDEPMLEFEAESDTEQDNSEGVTAPLQSTVEAVVLHQIKFSQIKKLHI